MESNKPPLPEIILRHFKESNAEEFYDMVNDASIKEFIEELDAPKDQVLCKFNGLNDNIYYHQYWGIFKPDGTLVGFISLKKNKSIYKALAAKDLAPTQSVDDFELPTEEEVKDREWRAKVNAPYAIDVVIHRNYRKFGFAQAAIRKIIAYASAAGVKRLYFEINAYNEKSLQMIESLHCRSVIDAANHYGHEVFEYELIPSKLTTAEIMHELNTLPNDQERNAFNFWRQMTDSFPELIFHRDILTSFYNAIVVRDVIIKPTDNVSSCQYTTDLYENLLWVSLQPREEQLTIIWSIAHEYGHMCQPEATVLERKLHTREKYLREADAWDKAELWLKDKTIYLHNWPSFIKFRDSRLENYLPPKASIL
jgi:RimJ/RimL family protein N-acetyltransferase